jgi:hypothetical protein
VAAGPRLAKTAVAEGHPGVLGIDIVFAEPDRLSPPEIAPRVPTSPASLAHGLAQPPPRSGIADAMRVVPDGAALAPPE